ncbi:MAG: sugar ABC transporter ATP-binding protein [Chromatocurvus sp.]
MPESHAAGTVASDAENLLLNTRGVSKSFAVPVLKSIDFTLQHAEVHALMGSNGAGKSTLCNIIAGVLQASSGDLYLRGERFQPDSIRDAEQRGIRMVMQELNLFPTLSIAENLAFGRFGGGAGIIRHDTLYDRAKSALATLGLDELDPDMPVSRLGVGQQQLVEIARVISRPLSLLILDEPTAALTDPQIARLFTSLEQLRAQGVGIIYISHRMDEIRRIADRVSVLRDGNLVATAPADSLDSDQIVTLMAGEKVVDGQTTTQRHAPATRAIKPLMKVDQLGRTGSFTDISFTLHAGEVLGIGGLIGAGRSELLRGIFGADRVDGGGIRLASDEFRELRRMRSPQEAVRAGLGMVVEDRKSQGLLLQSSIARNLSLARLPELHSPLGMMDASREEDIAATMCRSLDINYRTLAQPVSELSGGNQQKVLIGRWLLKQLPILLFDEPGRGVDARAKARIQLLVRELAASGKAVLVVSSETEELRALSDRILVLSNGRLAAEFTADAFDEAAFLAACFRFYSSSAQATANGEVSP